MGDGYIRQDVGDNIANGNVIDADYLDAEYNALEAAFNNVSGHTHDGTVGNGAPITVVGPLQDYTASGTALTPKTDSTYDLGADAYRWSTVFADAIRLGEATLSWNANDKTVDATLNATGVTLQVGQESLVLVQNDTGATLTNGTVVRYAGAIGASGKFRVEKMAATSSDSGHLLLGVVTEDIDNGEVGFATSFGMVRGIDTSAWAAGTMLWCDPANPGGLTSTEPSSPNLRLPIAVVTTSHAVNGVLFVRVVTPGTSLKDDQLVSLSGLTDGDLLVYKSANSRFENTSALDSLTTTVLATADAYSDNFFASNGTAAEPAYTATSDTNTGLYFPSADQIGFSVGGTLRGTLTSSGWTGMTIVSPTISGGSISGITDLAVADGGTGASTAADARTNLGLTVGTDVQAYDATLQSLSSLGTAANQLAYTTGVDTWAETAISSFGRSLIDDANATTARGTLGIGAGIPQDSIKIPGSANLNTYTTPGFYHQPSNAGAGSGSNYPTSKAGALTVVRTGVNSGNAVAQIYNQYYQASDGGPRMFIRAQEDNGSWSSWEELLSSRSLMNFLASNIGGRGMPQFLRRSASNASIVYNTQYSGADLRRTGVQMDSGGSDVWWDQSGGIAPAGSFTALGAVGARSGWCSATLFLRTV